MSDASSSAKRRLARPDPALTVISGLPSAFDRLVGGSEAMQAAIRRLRQVAAHDATLLIKGESGTGKELAAEAVHQASRRRSGPFVIVDCSAIARNLIEAQLFGHERGAYTGAVQSREGAFSLAHGGTIFLDEVGELDLDLQPRLLRAIEKREVTPLGGSKSRHVDVRIIAATNRDLHDEVARGTFRADLYYRLAVTTVRLPPLRDRAEDIVALCDHFMKQLSIRDGDAYRLDESLLRRLASLPWPGNVRQLKNTVERIVVFGTEEADDSGLILLPVPIEDRSDGQSFHSAKAQVIAVFERAFLSRVLGGHGNNITAAARACGVDRVHFLRLLDRHGLRGSAKTPGD